MKKVIVIGAGIAGLSAATTLAQKGYEVLILEKNTKPGGRINTFSHEGFTFDMGPSWYWMPDVFENYYQQFGYTTSDFYELQRLDPSYKVVFKDKTSLDVPATYQKLLELFETIEPGSSSKLDKFLVHAEYKYRVGMNEFVWKPGKSISEFMDFRVLKSVLKLQMFSSISKEIRKVVKNDKLRQILEFPVLFLGAAPADTPALYSLMNYADIKLGTWYPKGGMYKIAEAFEKIALSMGVKMKYDTEVIGFKFEKANIKSVLTNEQNYSGDLIIANADYHHVDQNLLPSHLSNYSSAYWESRKMAPSSLLVFLGVNKKLPNLEHHNLFFDAEFDRHADQIYKKPTWPDDPLFYVCCPSKTDTAIAPQGSENLFLLMPIAPGLDGDSQSNKDMYFDLMLKRIENHLGTSISNNIVYKKYFSLQDFKSYYNAFKGNAYGLANTLLQTALLKPSLNSKKISNLFYTGQLTTPGPGLPPAIISGQVVALEVIKKDKKSYASLV